MYPLKQKTMTDEPIDVIVEGETISPESAELSQPEITTESTEEVV